MDITLPYRIFAVDPATTKSGWSVLDVVSLKPLKINIVAHGLIDGDTLFRKRKDMQAIFQKQYCVIDGLLDEYIRLMNLYKPDQGVSEGAFSFNHASAVVALTLAIGSLRRASHAVLNKDIIIVPPTITKKAFTGSGTADKDIMRLAYQTNTYLEGRVPDDQISEHEIDSVGHGCAHVFRDVLGTIRQISALDKKRLKREKQKAKEALKEQT